MTNLRILKKKCKQAVAILCRDYGYSPADFMPADGDESIYAPTGIERRFTQWRFRGRVISTDFLRPGPLRGTPLYWYRCSYEYDEWDYKLPTDLLAKHHIAEVLAEEMEFEDEAA